MKRNPTLLVIDGQGGGIGSTLISGARSVYGEAMEIVAVGTNAIATAAMMRAGANRGATGENAVVRAVLAADLIIAPLAVSWANAMMGEVTGTMASAITSACAPKIYLPLFKENASLVGLTGEPLPHLVEEIVHRKIKEAMNHV